MIEDLRPTDDQCAFADAASRCFAGCAGLAPEAIADRLSAEGLLTMLAPEEAGGLGLGLRAAVPVARAAGAAVLAFPLIEAMLAARFAASQGVVLEGLATIAWSGHLAVNGARAGGNIGRAPAAKFARQLVARAGDGDDPGVAITILTDANTQIAEAGDLDLDRSYGDARLIDVGVAAWAPGGWQSIADAAAVLHAAEMLGAAEASFAEACAHVTTRRQFGRPLSAQQTIATALARDHFALTGAGLCVDYAALALDEARDDAADASDIACAVAADAAIAAAENAIQLHGAIGFTWAMALHRRLRRIQATADIHTPHRARAALADRLLADWAEAA